MPFLSAASFRAVNFFRSKAIHGTCWELTSLALQALRTWFRLRGNYYYYYYYYYTHTHTHTHTHTQQQQQHLTCLACLRWLYVSVEQMKPNAPHSCPNLTISPALLASFLEYATHPPVHQSQPVDWLPLYKILEGSGSQLLPEQRLGVAQPGFPSRGV